jgi:signal transduction histidine kinase
LDQKVKERTKKVRKLAAELLHAENEERRRIAHMLHEDLQQQLYVLKMDLNHSRDMLDSKADTEFISQLTEWESILKKSLILTKDLALDLSPPFPGDITLNEAVEWLALHMKETYDQDVKLDIKKTIQWPGENLIHMLIQMLRELLFNVVKHAGVDRARIKIDSVKGDLRLNVEDKGSGFDKKINGTFAEVSECYGLKNIRHRIELLGGEFEIDTAPGRGTKIKLSIPTDHPVDSTKQSR